MLPYTVKVLNSRVANPYHTFKLMLRVTALALERKEEIIKTGTYRYIFALFIKKNIVLHGLTRIKNSESGFFS